MMEQVQGLLLRMRRLPLEIQQMRRMIADMMNDGSLELADGMKREADGLASQYQRDSVALMRNLGRLSHGDVIVLYRFYVLRQSNAEIAAREHVDISVIKRRKRLAIQHLEEVWKREQ